MVQTQPMTTARSQQIDLSATPYYHVVSRCVRRAFLCGEDRLSERSFDHRRGWLVERFRFLSEHYAIDIAGFACLSNHYHLVLRVDRERATGWSDEEVVQRWMALSRRSRRKNRKRAESPSRAQLEALAPKISVWRERLYDISWFMRMLNEYIARRANQEDNCKGRFWESRFKSQALLDMKAIISVMAYVDLNPIRAKMADSLLKSDYTSIQERMVRHAKRHTPNSNAAKQGLPYRSNKVAPLLPFSDEPARLRRKHPVSTPLPFSFAGYVELVDWTGRQLRKHKRGAIPENARSALTELGLDAIEWVTTVKCIRYGFGHAVGDVTALSKWCENLGQQWVKGMGLDKRRPAQQQV